MRQEPRIVAAAINHNGKVWTGKNHCEIMRQIWTASEEGVAFDIPKEEQGFVTDTGVFVNRFQAGAVAFRSGQTPVRHEILQSYHVGLSQDF